MEADKQQADSNNSLCRCPYCSCCFCNEADLKRHIQIFGAQQRHLDEFKRVHGRLEHGSFGGPE